MDGGKEVCGGVKGFWEEKNGGVKRPPLRVTQ